MLVLRYAAMLALLVLSGQAARAETVRVLGRGPVDLTNFVCESIMRNVTRGAIRRICYDEINSYVVVQLGSLYLHYCEVEPHSLNNLVHAESVIRHFSAELSGRYNCGSRYPRYD
jgi:hypothetical protein